MAYDTKQFENKLKYGIIKHRLLHKQALKLNNLY